MRLTPVLLYSVLLIGDILIHSPLNGNYTQGALGNIISIVIVIFSILSIIVDRFVAFNVYDKSLFIIELLIIILSYLIYWLVFSYSPFPTLR